MKFLNARQQQIFDLAKQQGRVDVENLAEHFDVTSQTIRRDLNELCEMKHLGRVHGGAVYLSGVSNFAYTSRRLIAVEGKNRIAQATAEIIPDNASVILNIGTTTEQVAHALCKHKGLLVITNNLNIANILLEESEAEVLIAGGTARRADGGIIGASAVEFISQYKADYAVVGVSAIDEDGLLFDFDDREVQVSRAIIDHARHVILVSDGMKFERKAPACIGHISRIDTFVTDFNPPPGFAEICSANGVKIIATEETPESQTGSADE